MLISYICICFLDPIEVDVLQACVMIAKMLLNVDESGITETVITGGTHAMNIPVAKFTEENCQFKPARNVCKNISDRLKVILGNEYDLVGDFAILTTPGGAQRQYIHSDSIFKNQYNGLIVLSASAKPTIFLPKQHPDICIYEKPALNKNCRIVDKAVRSQVQQKFSGFWGPISKLEKQMRPITANPLQSGDMILFEADMVHRGDVCSDNKTLLFFHAQQASNEPVSSNTQNHAGMLGHLIYGCTPSKREEQEYFTFLNRHINSISAPVVDLTTFLDESTIDWYNEMELQQHPKLQ